MIEFLLPGMVVAVTGVIAVSLFTKRGSPARAWIIATPNRVAILGIAVLVFLWACVAIYNQLTEV